MKEISRHIILYAKLWYKHSGNHASDIQQIINHFCEVDYKEPQYGVVLEFVVDAFLEFTEPVMIRRVLTEKLFNWFDDRFTRPLTVEKYLEVLLSMMSVTPVRDRATGEHIELGEPDYTVLDASDNAKAFYAAVEERKKKLAANLNPSEDTNTRVAQR